MLTWPLLLCAARGGAAALLRPLGAQVQRAAPPMMAGGPQPARGPLVVIGGGVAGLCSALELASRGWAVTVLSRNAGEAASLAAGGMLAPQAERLPPGPLLDLCLRARDHFPKWLARVEAASGVDAGYVANGGFVAPAFASDAVDRWSPPPAAGRAVRLGAAAALRMEPLLSPSVAGGWWYPREASVDPRLLHTALTGANPIPSSYHPLP